MLVWEWKWVRTSHTYPPTHPVAPSPTLHSLPHPLVLPIDIENPHQLLKVVYIYIYTLYSLLESTHQYFLRAIRFVVLHYWSIHILFEIRVLSVSHLMKLAVGNIRELLTHLISEFMMGKYRKICTSLHPENTDFIEIPWWALIFPYTCILCQNVEMNFNVSFTCYNFLGV